jgi:leucyl/phenylalanyl-tRNA--protein transferase
MKIPFKKSIIKLLPKSIKYFGRVTRLSKKIVFPPFEKGNKKFRFGPMAYLLAYGGDLSVERLVKAFSLGIMPFFEKNEPIQWWTSDKRMILFLNKLHVEQTMRKVIRKGEYNVTADTVFYEVIEQCKKNHLGYNWLNNQRIAAIGNLYESGYAHSIEVWHNERLVGGLFGIQIGRFFYAESMFSTMRNSSKYGFIAVALRLRELGFEFFDEGIWPTKHIESTGAEFITRAEFLDKMSVALQQGTYQLNWSDIFIDWDCSDALKRFIETTSK